MNVDSPTGSSNNDNPHDAFSQVGQRIVGLGSSPSGSATWTGAAKWSSDNLSHGVGAHEIAGLGSSDRSDLCTASRDRSECENRADSPSCSE